MKFTGHERDFNSGTLTENSNYNDYMHARSTVPQWGRFLSVDPGKVDPKQPQSWNRYSYVMNNPMNGTDPTGKCGEWVDLSVRDNPVRSSRKPRAF